MKNQKRVQEALDRARNEILEAPQQQSLDEEPKENATIVIERKQVDDEESQTKKKDALDMEEKGELSFEKGTLMLPKDDKRNSSSFKSRFFESQIINHLNCTRYYEFTYKSNSAHLGRRFTRSKKNILYLMFD